jgi:hypothetical protein
VAPAEFIGKMYEWGSTPMDTLKMMMGSEPKADYLMDLHNNAYGAKLGMQAKSQGELEDMVQREAERAQLNAPADRALLIPPSVKPEGYAAGGVIRSAVKASKEAPAMPTSVLDKIRSLFAAEPEQVVEALGNVPMSRRGFLRTTASPAVQAGIRTMVPELAEALPSAASVLKPAAAQLTPRAKTGAMNLMANVARMSRAPSALDRASLVSVAVPEGMSLKQFMREVKTEPDVYNTMMKDVERLGLEERFGQAHGSSKEDYMSQLKDMGTPEGSIGREAKLWDKYGGNFKEPTNYVSENVKPRMFDVDMSAPEWFYDLDSATQERLKDKLMGVPTNEALDKLKAFKQVFAPQMKLQNKEAAALYGQIANAQSASPLTIPAALSGLNSRVGRVLEIDMPYGVSPSLERINRMTPDELPLSELEYDMQLEAAKDALSRSIYDKGYRKGYKALGLEIPEYVPSEKAQFKLEDTPKPEGFAKGGAVSADERASFGVFPQMKPRRAKQDREAAKDLPLSALRGYIAGTLGLPGDLESLGRMLIPGVSNEPALPDSEYFRKVLPLQQLQDTPAGRAFTELGGAAGGVGLGPLAKLAGRGAGAVARGGAEQIARAVEAGHPLTAGFAPMNVIKPKGGQWLSGSVEESLRGLRRAENLDNPEQAQSLNKFVEGPLTKYVKTQMATPEDPVRAMAERGVLHVSPQRLILGDSTDHMSGDVLQKLGQTPTAKSWENAADSAIYPDTVGNLFDPSMGSAYNRTALANDPWLSKVSPETIVNAPTYGMSPEHLGFGHLTDELRNALNPESGLPRHLLLTPEQMKGYGVEKAVQRVADINDWRAAQKAEASQARAHNPASVMFKEYPGEANPRGLHWRELKGADPKLYRESTMDKYNAGNEALQDQLKYEGEQMGHCVGGYCPDVVEGRSEIYSLRDAKGQPHVTIETKPDTEVYGNKFSDVFDKAMEHVTDAEYANLENNYGDDVFEGLKERFGNEVDNPYEAIGDIVGTFGDDASLRYSTYLKNKPQTYSIQQIKGKGNKAPVEEYLPMVQDFVKSGKWSDVGDLQNTGLQKWDDKYLTRAEIDALSPADSDAFSSRNLGKPGFAAGGLVNDSISGYNPARVDEIVNSLRTELFQ